MAEEVAGRATLGIGLIAGGMVAFMASAGCPVALVYLRTYWPILLVVLGVEILWKERRATMSSEPARVRIDVLSVVLLVALVFLINATAFALPLVSRGLPPALRGIRLPPCPW